MALVIAATNNVHGSRFKFHAVQRASTVQSVSKFFHRLPSGHSMEVLVQNAEGGIAGKMPILFIHGSYHAAWCWAVHWMPLFSAVGHDCFALSLLGQGESDAPPQQKPRSLLFHTRDVAHFIKQNLTLPPVIIGHSFGGLIVQSYLSFVSSEPPSPKSESLEGPYPSIARAVLACSVPPSGNNAVVMRYLRRKPLASIKVTYSLAAKGFARSVPLCRETFFSNDMADSEVKKYQTMMKNSSRVPLFNIRQLNASLPVGRASPHAPPVFVVGAEHDFILDKEALEETAAFYCSRAVVIPGVAHDIMLDVRQHEAASVVLSWLNDP